MIEKLKSYPFFLKNNLTFLLIFFSLFLFFNELFRIVFLFHNMGSSAGSSLSGILLALIVGLRFDIAVFSFINIIPSAILLLPLSYLQIQKRFRIAAWGLILLNAPIFFVNGIDVAYFEYSGKRSTFELLVLKKDIFSFSPMLLLQYSWLVFIFMGMLAGIYYLLFRWHRGMRERSYFTVQRRAVDFLLMPAIVALMLVGMRGGLQLRALRPAMAFFSPDFFLGHVASNSAFNLIKSMGDSGAEKLLLLDDNKSVAYVRGKISGNYDGEYISNIYPLIRKTEFSDATKKYNIVIFVMESMNAENVGVLNSNAAVKNLTPNFDRLSRKGILFTNYHSNAKRSIEAFPAILNSLPDILQKPLITSEYETNATWGIGNILKSMGYKTFFFHGGRNGSMGLDQYAKISGFEKYYGMDEYTSAHGIKNFDEHWGIFDDAFFDYFFENISVQNSPYFATIFSLSNHHPYDLPAHGWDWLKTSKLTDPEKGMRYADESLGKFFARAEKMEQFKNTIFIITADHYTFNSLKPDRDIMTVYHIPLLLYAPGILKPSRDDRMANHLNLLPTLIDLMKIKTFHASAGKSLLDASGKGYFTFLQNNGIFTYAEDSEAVVTDFDKLRVFYMRKNNRWDEAMLSPVREIELYEAGISFYQTYHNIITTNTLTSRDYMRVE